MSVLQHALDIFNFYNVERVLQTPAGRLENDAEHTWSISMLYLQLKPLLAKEFGELDEVKIFNLIVIHDIGELFTGDIPTWDKKENNKKDELSFIIDYLTNIHRSDLIELAKSYETKEFDNLSTEEKIVKSLDRMMPTLLRLKSGEGYTHLKHPYNTLEHIKGRQMVRHSFSAVMTQLFNDAMEYAVANNLVDPNAS